MPEPPVEVVRRILAAWNEGDLGVELFDPGVEMRQYQQVFDTAGEFHGHAGLAESARELFRGFRDIQWKPREFIPAPGGRVVVPVSIHAIGRASGAPVHAEAVHLWTVRDGLAVRWTAYEELDEARAAAGLEP
ncbi:MAG: hypothetical protein QOE65_2739 [Solirubrobacteraceae bacterium]|jgi:ketosteroid isomerase-like protein|nr:hypothetical protein [Solirubrobacteraceae bacterium]